MNLWFFAAFLLLLLSLPVVNASEATRSEAPAPAPSKGTSHPWTNEERVRTFSANAGRALFSRWGQEKYSSLHDLSCLVKYTRDGQQQAFRQKTVSKDPAVNELFAELIKGIQCDTRPLGPLDSATLEIELQSYPNAMIRQSFEDLASPAVSKTTMKTDSR